MEPNGFWQSVSQTSNTGCSTALSPGLSANIQPVKMRFSCAVELDLVDLDERRGLGLLGGRARVAHARGHLQRAELHRLIERAPRTWRCAPSPCRARRRRRRRSRCDRRARRGHKNACGEAGEQGLRRANVQRCMPSVQAFMHRGHPFMHAPAKPSLSAELGRSWTPSRLRAPGLVVAGGLGPHAARQDRSRRPVGLGRPGHVHEVRPLPRPRLIVLRGRRLIDRVVQPAVPVGAAPSRPRRNRCR